MWWWQVRPRYGQLLRADGSVVPLVFHPSGKEPEDYVARYADSYDQVVVEPGDSMSVDRMADGQSVSFRYAGDGLPDQPRVDRKQRRGLVRRLLLRALGL